MPKKFSVYDRHTDLPIAINQTSRECAKALRISVKSFYRQLCRSRHGNPPKRYEIIEDKEENEETC